MTNGFLEFEFDLPDALLAGLVKTFSRMSAALLARENLVDLPEAQGVYQLLIGDKLVYIGKTDAELGLKKRLERHAWTIQHRHNLDPQQILFKAVRVFVFTAMDLESQLIRHYDSIGKVAWNNSGFGSNDPGRNRDLTELKPEGFDALYPIDIDRPLDWKLVGSFSAATVLAALKTAVPYTFRFESSSRGSRKPHADLQETQVNIGEQVFTTRSLLTKIISHLPQGWQATTLPSRVIMYKEMRDYSTGEIVARS